MKKKDVFVKSGKQSVKDAIRWGLGLCSEYKKAKKRLKKEVKR